MSQVLLINPRRKRRATSHKRRAKSHKRRVRVSHLMHNPKRRRRVARKAVARVTHKRRSRRTGRRSMGMRGFVKGTLMPASVGAGGALMLNLALGYLPVPAALNTSLIKPVVGIAGAAALGMIASKIGGRQMGEQVATGAIVVVLYQLFNNTLKTVMPSLPLSGPRVGWVNPGLPVGEYVGASSRGTVQPMGEYVGVSR